MKTTLFVKAASVVALLLLSSTANAKSWRIHNDTKYHPHFTDINAAMSSAEVQAGDTLYLSKSDELSGREATILGSLRNFTDRFCIVVNADTSALVKAINVTEMQEIWAEDNYQVEK